MKISGFDWDKGNWPKCGKHGLLREEIERFFLTGKAQIAPDLKHIKSGEYRYIATGRIEERPVFVAFVVRNSLIRPISARYMHEEEAKNYEKST